MDLLAAIHGRNSGAQYSPMKLNAITRFVNTLSHVVLREEAWSFNSRYGPEELIAQLRLESERGGSSQWVSQKLRILRSGKEFIGEIDNDKVEIFRRVGLISWLTGNTMYHFSGQVRPLPSGSEIKGKYLMDRSAKLFFMFGVLMSCLISIGIIIVSAARIIRQFVGDASVDYRELLDSSMLIVVAVILIFGEYVFFGFFKVMEQGSRNALYGFLEKITEGK